MMSITIDCKTYPDFDSFLTMAYEFCWTTNSAVNNSSHQPQSSTPVKYHLRAKLGKLSISFDVLCMDENNFILLVCKSRSAKKMAFMKRILKYICCFYVDSLFRSETTINYSLYFNFSNALTFII